MADRMAARLCCSGHMVLCSLPPSHVCTCSGYLRVCPGLLHPWEPIPHHTHESGSLPPSYHCLSSLLRLALSPTLILTPTPTLVLYSPNHTLTLTLTLTLTRRHPFSPPSSFVSMLSLLVLLAPVGAAGTCTLTRSGRNEPLFSVLNVHPTVPPSCPKP